MRPLLLAACCGLLLATTSCTDGGEAPVAEGANDASDDVTVGASIGASAAAGGAGQEPAPPVAPAHGAPATASAPANQPAALPPPAPPAPAPIAQSAPEPAPPANGSDDAPPSSAPEAPRKPGWAPWGPAKPPTSGPTSGPTSEPTPRQATPPTTDLVTVRDPVEDAYTVGVPRGWHSRTHSVRVLDLHRSVLTSVSPDGSVVIFSGDPALPNYTSPEAATPVHHDMARVHPAMKIEPFTPATRYFPDYVRQKFGALAGFELLGVEDDPGTAERLRARAAQEGMTTRPTAANVSFRYADGGRRMSALVRGITSDSGGFWWVSVSGIATEGGDPRQYVPMLEAIGASYRTNPTWKAEQDRRHQERMAQIEAWGRQSAARHQQNMAAMQQSARAHQDRMRALQAQGDASMRSFQERMASSDAQHRGFINSILEEHTVVDSRGRTYQVDASYQRYFVNRHDGTYVGGHAGADVESLRALGLDPSDYEEVKIAR